METLHQTDLLRKRLQQWRQEGQRIAFVPTMGNLHAGHISLVEEARRQSERVVVSIFVNPAQFGPNEDFDAYPRTLQADQQKLQEAGTDMLFAPGVQEIYPEPNQCWVDVDILGQHLCGANRPGHFRGVCTVVAKLFNIVQPDVACFGEKDFQQLAIIRKMTRDLCFPITLIGVPTLREENGLAMSSRNGYLSNSERSLANQIYQHLLTAKKAILDGERDYRALEKQLSDSLQAHGFQVDYLTVANQHTLVAADAQDRELVVAIAAKLGLTRLIDNITLAIVPSE